MHFVKYMDSRFVDDFCARGRILLRSLDYYSWLEEIGEAPGIGDRFENKTEMTFDLEWSKATSREQKRLAGFIGGDGSASFEGGRVIYPEPHSFVLCYAGEEQAGECREVFSKYDAQAVITDPEGLADAIWKNGVVHCFNGNKSRLGPACDLLNKPEVKKVSYGKRQYDITEDEVAGTGAFVKPAHFDKQKEWRAVFKARNDLMPDDIMISFPESERFLKAQILNDQASRQEEQAIDRSACELIRELKVQIEALRHEMITPPNSAVAQRFSPEEWRERGNAWETYLAARGERFSVELLKALWRLRAEEGIRWGRDLYTRRDVWHIYDSRRAPDKVEGF